MRSFQIFQGFLKLLGKLLLYLSFNLKLIWGLYHDSEAHNLLLNKHTPLFRKYHHYDWKSMRSCILCLSLIIWIIKRAMSKKVDSIRHSYIIGHLVFWQPSWIFMPKYGCFYKSISIFVNNKNTLLHLFCPSLQDIELFYSAHLIITCAIKLCTVHWVNIMN